MAIQDELKLFVENFKLENGRIPTQNEIVKGTGRAAKTIKSYLVEGVDYAKPLTKLEAAKLGGKKRTGITKVDSKLLKEFKDLTVKGISPSIDTSAVGSKAWRVKFDPKLNLKTISIPATKENLEKIKIMVSEVVDSDNYNKNILPFQTSEEKRKIRRYKEASYKKKDPFRIYYKLSRYKGEKFPGSLSKDIVIQHGQPKFTTQTLNKFALIPSAVNISETVEKVERLRNNALKIALATLNNKNADVATKKAAAEKYNSIAKGLRGQLKGEASGVVNFELLEVDDKGNFKKIKDIGFDPTKALVASDKDLSKITKLEAEELLKAGKKKIDIEALKLTTDVKPLSRIDRPEKALLTEDFKAFSSRLKNYDNLDPTTYPSKTYVRSELKKVPVEAPVNQAIKDFDIPKGTILKGLAKGTLRAVAPFVPFVGALGVALGVSDVAKAKDEGLEGEELGIAYLVGPELAKKYSDFKDRNLNVETESDGIMGLKNGGRVGFQGGGMDASQDDFSGGGKSKGRQDPMGGREDFTAEEIRAADPIGYGGGLTGPGFQDRDDQPPTNIPPPPKDGTIPITINLGTDDVLGVNIPTFVDFGLPTKYGLLNLRQRFSDFINPDEIDLNPELTFGGSVPLFGGDLRFGIGATKEGLMKDPSPFITFSKVLGGDKRR